MATDYTYPDAYLQRFCTPEREDRAKSDITVHGSFNDAWTERLVILRVYVLACLENQSDTEDVFGVKLKHYRGEFDAALAAARAQAARDAATATGTLSGFGFLTIPLERG